jgi:hypothetical protein
VRRKTIVFGILLLLGFVSGILFQRTFTVGQTYRQIISLFREPDTRPVAIQRKVRDPIDWAAYSERLDQVHFFLTEAADNDLVIKKLREQIPQEIDFRSSPEVQRTYRILEEVKKDNGITRLEVHRNIFLRREEVEYQSEDSAYEELWISRYEAVVAFHRHLQERGIHLVFMPVPNQVDIELPVLTNSKRFLSSSPQHTRFLLRLAESGVDVIDLRYEMGTRSLSGEPMFNRFDHHWTPQAVEVGAKLLASRIHLRASGLPSEPLVRFEHETVSLAEPVISFPGRWESKYGTPIFARSVRSAGRMHQGFAESKIVILGDSMVLMYAAPHAADLGAHTSALLGYPCETIGKGSGSPLVPKMFFSRYGTQASENDPHFVVWVGVSRHQDYQPIEVGRFSSPEPGVYRVTIVDRPPFPDLATAPYPNALYAVEVSIEESGASPQLARVFATAFENRELTPTGNLKRGETRAMKLVPWRTAVKEDPNLLQMATIDGTLNLELPEFYWEGD